MMDPEINDKHYYFYTRDLDNYYLNKYFDNIMPKNNISKSNSFYLKFVLDVDLKNIIKELSA